MPSLVMESWAVRTAKAVLALRAVNATEALPLPEVLLTCSQSAEPLMAQAVFEVIFTVPLLPATFARSSVVGVAVRI